MAFCSAEWVDADYYRCAMNIDEVLRCNGSMRPLSILVLGGTGFIGPQQLRYATSRGHRVTIFNRGSRSAELPDRIEALMGDRDAGDYSALLGRSFDVCIDNACSVPHWVRDAADVLAGSVGHYIFVSTISVYADNAYMGQDETAPRETYCCADGRDAMAVTRADLNANMALYGPLKARCEDEVHMRFSGISTVIRPGLIVGPGDQTDRFTYWPVRIARGGDVLVPPRVDPVQIIDVRDLAEWTIRVAEMRVLGDFNAVGPDCSLTMGAMLDCVRAVTKSDAYFREASADFLRMHGVRAWLDLPVWIPGEGDTAGFHQRSNARAIAAGLTFRSLATTVADTLTAWQHLPDTRKTNLKVGLSAERESEILALLAA
jgi:2'-hydroxyisoflavone reductase